MKGKQKKHVSIVEPLRVDIKKPVAAEKELRKSEDKYRMLYESMRDGFVLTDMQMHIIESNSFFLIMTGYSL
jgi:PAS domain-containing protein